MGKVLFCFLQIIPNHAKMIFVNIFEILASTSSLHFPLSHEGCGSSSWRLSRHTLLSSIPWVEIPNDSIQDPQIIKFLKNLETR